MPTPLHAPTERPDEPVTAGAALGEGPGQDALNMPPEGAKAEAKRLAPLLPAMIAAADSQYATPEFRRYVRTLISLQ
jgi:hypothetical protein